MLVKAHQDTIDIKYLKRHFMKLAQYDISEKRIQNHLASFLTLLRKEKLYG